MRHSIAVIGAAILAASPFSTPAAGLPQVGDGPKAAATSGSPILNLPLTTQGAPFEEDANTVLHLRWNNGLIDSKGNTWTQNGTVPQVLTSPLFTAGTNAGRRAVGPFTAANNFVAPNNTVGEFAGDWSASVAFIPASVGAAQAFVAKVNGAATIGWFCRLETSGAAAVYVHDGALKSASTANTVIVNSLNTLTCGRSGGTIFVRLNGGTVASTAGVGSMTSAAAEPLVIGRQGTAGAAATTTSILEVTMSTTAYVDATTTTIQATAFANGNPNRPLFNDTATDVLHLVGSAFNGTTWGAPQLLMTTNGTVPFADLTSTGTNPAVAGILNRQGAGPYSAANNYAATSTALGEWAGDWSVTVVFKPGSLVAGQTLISKGNATSGWFVFLNATGRCAVADYDGTQDIATAPGDSVLNAINVCTAGRSGGSIYAKQNTGIVASAVSGTMTAASALPFRIGKDAGSGADATTTTIYEVIASTTPYSDALHLQRWNRATGQIDAQSNPITVTRTTPQTLIIPSAGAQTLWTVPPGTLAIEPAGASIWAAGTNSALQSETSCVANAVQAPWILVGAPTCVTDAAVAPDGLLEMDQWTSAVNTDLVSQPVTIASSTTFTFSSWMQKTATGTATLVGTCTAGTATACTCATSDGTACTPATATTNCVAKFTAVGTTPVRGWASTTCLAALTNPTASFSPGEFLVSTGTTRFYGAQVEPGLFPTPYKPTTTVAVTHNATVATAPLPALGNKWCVMGTATPAPGRAWNDAGTYRIAGLGTIFGANSAGVYVVGGSLVGAFWDSAAVIRSASSTPPWAAQIGTTHRAGICDNAGTITTCGDGATLATAATGGTGAWSTPPTTLNVGHSVTSQWTGLLRDLNVCPNKGTCGECP